MNNDFEKMWKEAFMAYRTNLSKNHPRRIKLFFDRKENKRTKKTNKCKCKENRISSTA
jgi:type III secretory pathway component EscR